MGEDNSNESKSFLLSKEAFSLVMEYKFGPALKKLNQAIELEPNNAYAYCTKAFILGANRRYDQSLDLCKKALKINSFTAEAWMIAGNDLEMLAINEEIKRDLDKAKEYHRLAKEYWMEAKSISPDIVLPFTQPLAEGQMTEDRESSYAKASEHREGGGQKTED